MKLRAKQRSDPKVAPLADNQGCCSDRLAAADEAHRGECRAQQRQRARLGNIVGGGDRRLGGQTCLGERNVDGVAMGDCIIGRAFARFFRECGDEGALGQGSARDIDQIIFRHPRRPGKLHLCEEDIVAVGDVHGGINSGLRGVHVRVLVRVVGVCQSVNGRRIARKCREESVDILGFLGSSGIIFALCKGAREAVCVQL